MKHKIKIVPTRQSASVRVLQRENRKLREAGFRLIDLYIADRGFFNPMTKGKTRRDSREFLACVVSFHRNNPLHRKCPYWKAWDNLRLAVGDESMPG